jgi:hypothetical protein
MAESTAKTNNPKTSQQIPATRQITNNNSQQHLKHPPYRLLSSEIIGNTNASCQTQATKPERLATSLRGVRSEHRISRNLTQHILQRYSNNTPLPNPTTLLQQQQNRCDTFTIKHYKQNPTTASHL